MWKLTAIVILGCYSSLSQPGIFNFPKQKVPEKEYFDNLKGQVLWKSLLVSAFLKLFGPIFSIVLIFSIV